MSKINLEDIFKDAIVNKLDFYDLSNFSLNEELLKQLLIQINKNRNRQKIKYIIYNKESYNRNDLSEIDKKLRKIVFFHEMKYLALKNFIETRLKSIPLDFKDQLYFILNDIKECKQKSKIEIQEFNTIEKIQLELEINNIAELRVDPNMWHHYLCCIMALAPFKINSNLNLKLKTANWKKMGEITIGQGNKEIVLPACIYRNHKSEQIVVSFPYSNDNVNDNISKYESIHNIYQRVSNVLNLIKDNDIIINSNSITFVGYSFAAWYAELSVYLCAKLKFFNNKRINSQDPPTIEAITFESPGSFELLKLINSIQNDSRDVDLNLLKISSFFCDPNFLNTSYRHIGKQYFISTNKEEKIIMIRDYLQTETKRTELLDTYKDDLGNEIVKNILIFYFQGIFKLKKLNFHNIY